MVRRKMKYDTKALNDIPFEQVAERYASNLVRKGAQLLMLCPWHDDHHPSLNVSPKSNNRCKCWACGKSAGVIDFVMAVNNCDFKEACEILSRDFNISIIEEEIPTKLKTKSVTCSKPTKCKQSKRKKNIVECMKEMESINNAQKKCREEKQKREKEMEDGLSFITQEFVREHVSVDNSLCKCLRSVACEELISYVTEEYQLGCYSKLGNEDDVMFPSIDALGRVHNVKLQHYCTDPQSPRFMHKDDKHTYWLGSILEKQGKHDCIIKGSGFDCSCFFGEHLIPKYPSLTVVLVESPKNAVIGTCAFPNMVWVAVGNKGNLNEKRLQCLRNRDVIVLPDVDAIDEWKEKLKKLAYIANFVFPAFLETLKEDCGKKGDVADWIIKNAERRLVGAG